MRPRHLALVLVVAGGHLAFVLVVAVTAWLAPGAVHADLKLATLNVKGMVCQA